MEKIEIRKNENGKFTLLPYNIEGDTVTIKYKFNKVQILVEHDIEKCLTKNNRITLFESKIKDKLKIKRSKSSNTGENDIDGYIELNKLNKGDLFFTKYGHKGQLIKKRPYTILDLSNNKNIPAFSNMLVKLLDDSDKMLEDNAVENSALPEENNTNLENVKRVVLYRGLEKNTIGIDKERGILVKLIKLRPYTVEVLEGNNEYKEGEAIIITPWEDEIILLPDNKNNEEDIDEDGN